MSDKNKKEKNTQQTEEKKLTKYDLKMKRREEEKAKEERDRKIGTVVGIAVVVALVCLVVSFPIRSYLAVHETVVKINGEDISRVEFDYNFNTIKSSYASQYGSMISYLGLDLSADLSTQMYDDQMSWQDYFEQQTVDSIKRVKALKAQAEAAGFTYDTDEEFTEFRQTVEDAAAQVGSTVKDYLQQVYGDYATMGRLEDCVRESIWVNAYYDQVSEEKTPSDEEIQAYYEENRQSFDSVDYYQTVIKAELPTEPTELADQDAADDAAESDGETAYQPSDAEIEKAMEDAEALADDAEAVITEEGELKEGAKYSGTSGVIRDWLFEEGRSEGDTTVIRNDTSHQFYVLSFVRRYRDETPSVDMRIIMQTGDDGQAVLDEWKSGEATEESFGALADKYNEGTSFTAEGGYYEGVSPSGTDELLAEWLFAEGRTAGETTAITTEQGNTYIMYYVGPNDPEWKLNARSEMLSDAMETYLQEISEGVQVEDPRGNLNYLKLEAAAEETAESDAAGESETDSEEAGSGEE